MKKFLTKVITLLELMIGLGLLLGGVTGFFSYFLFNVLIGAMGFFILLDGLEKIDAPAPDAPSSPDTDKGKDEQEHRHWGGHRRDEQ